MLELKKFASDSKQNKTKFAFVFLYVIKLDNIILRNYIFWVVSQLAMNSLFDPFTFWNKPLMTLFIFICSQVRAIVFFIEIMHTEF